MKKVLFISSTGGHFEELMKLEPLMKKYDSYIATEKIKSNLYLKEKYKNKMFYLIYSHIHYSYKRSLDHEVISEPLSEYD